MTAHDTKQRLIEEGTALFLERGYHDTGIQDLLAAAGVPKGSFYHHFRSKEAFGLAVIETYGRVSLEVLDSALGDGRYPPLERVRRFFAGAFEQFEAAGCRRGCLLGNLGQELSEVSEAFRSSISQQLDEWALRIAPCLEEAKHAGVIAQETDTDGLARLLVDGFQGAALRMKLERGPAPLSRFLQHYFGE